MLRGDHFNVEMSNNVYVFNCEVSKDGFVDYQIKLFCGRTSKVSHLVLLLNGHDQIIF